MYEPKYLPKEQEDAMHQEFGDFNDFPPFFREITEDEFARSIFFSYTPEALESRQMCRPSGVFPDGRSVHATLYFYHDQTGVAIERVQGPFIKLGVHSPWTVRYYAFGCNHKYTEMSAKDARAAGHTHFGRCWHVWKCDVCGHVKAMDSSD